MENNSFEYTYSAQQQQEIERIRKKYLPKEESKMDLASAWGSLAMVIGIVVGVVGMVLVALAYPLYIRVLTREREKIAPEILKLTDELMAK